MPKSAEVRVPAFETERLLLRPFRTDDAPELHRILTEPDMLKYFPRPGGPPLDRVERLVARQIEQWGSVGYAWWAVELKSSGRLVGWNGLQYLPDTDETEIGYLLEHALWRQGLTTEASQVALRFGFRDLGLRTVIALAHPENGASRRVMEKLGMGFDCLREYFGMEMARYTLSAEDFAQAESRLQTPG
jgi:RimJ/RimL family protein N-acetyltransferase